MPEVLSTFQTQRHAVAEGQLAQPSIMFPQGFILAVRGDAGSVSTELLTIRPGGATLARVISTGHEIALREDDRITFLLPTAGRLDIRIGDRDYRVARNDLAAFQPTDRRTRSVADQAGRFGAVALQVSLERMHTLARCAETSVNRVFAQDGVSLQGEVGRNIARRLPQLADDLFRAPSIALPPRVLLAISHLIDDLLCEMIGRMPEGPASLQVLPAFHRVRQAEEMMHDQSDEPLSMIEIAQTLGISLRSLQLAFSAVHDGQSPRDVLNRIRLEKARQRLRQADRDGQVTRIALDSGFFHLGRFAQAYVRAYGERPSETLARRRA